MRARFVACVVVMVGAFSIAWQIFDRPPATPAPSIAKVVETSVPSIAASPPATPTVSAPIATSVAAPPRTLPSPSGPDHAVVDGAVSYRRIDAPLRSRHQHGEQAPAPMQDSLPAEPIRLPR